MTLVVASSDSVDTPGMSTGSQVSEWGDPMRRVERLAETQGGVVSRIQAYDAGLTRGQAPGPGPCAPMAPGRQPVPGPDHGTDPARRSPVGSRLRGRTSRASRRGLVAPRVWPRAFHRRPDPRVGATRGPGSAREGPRHPPDASLEPRRPGRLGRAADSHPGGRRTSSPVGPKRQAGGSPADHGRAAATGDCRESWNGGAPHPPGPTTAISSTPSSWIWRKALGQSGAPSSPGSVAGVVYHNPVGRCSGRDAVAATTST